MSDDFKQLEELAYQVHQDIYKQIGWNACFVSEKYMGILVLDAGWNVVFAWSKRGGLF